jgi:hypothetical protein
MSLKPVDRACPVPDDFRKGAGPERPACRQGLSEKRFPKAAALTSHSRQTRRKSVSLSGLAGSVCLLIVVLTHVAEAWHVLPGIGWGLPNSPGHYLDLFSAISGVVLLLAAYVLQRRISD